MLWIFFPKLWFLAFLDTFGSLQLLLRVRRIFCMFFQISATILQKNLRQMDKIFSFFFTFHNFYFISHNRFHMRIDEDSTKFCFWAALHFFHKSWHSRHFWAFTVSIWARRSSLQFFFRLHMRINGQKIDRISGT